MFDRLNLAIYRMDHGQWHLWPTAGIGTSWIYGIWAQVDGTHIINMGALLLIAFGSAVMGLYRLWESNQIKSEKERRLAEIEVDEARRASRARVPEVIVVSPGVRPPKEPSP